MDAHHRRVDVENSPKTGCSLHQLTQAGFHPGEEVRWGRGQLHLAGEAGPKPTLQVLDAAKALHVKRTTGWAWGVQAESKGAYASKGMKGK
jgi:hypothetical protein